MVRNENGMLIDAGDEKGLLVAMKKMMDTAQYYNKERISGEAAAAFSYETVAREIQITYDSLSKRID